MSFYRKIITAVVAFGLATTVFAANDLDNSKQNAADANQPQGLQIADAQADASQAVVEGLKVNVNKATLKELMQVKGLSRVKAKNIIAYRKKHGNFNSLDDLKLVKGFKKMKPEQLQAVNDQMSVD